MNAFISQIEFARPNLIFLGLFWALCIGIDYFQIFIRQELAIPVQKSRRNYPFIRRILNFSFLMLAVSCLTLAMMGPRIPKGFSEQTKEIRDIYFVVDVSLSMLAEDFNPNRLEVAKETIHDFIKMRSNDRVGIVAFSEDIVTLLPLTHDRELILKIVKQIKTGVLGSGTNIGDGLGLAVTRLTESLTTNKVIILLTDGVSNVGTLTPMQAAEMAKKEKIKVYTIAIGGDKDAKIPVTTDAFGRKRYQLIPGGSIDTKLLDRMAKMTRGKSYLAKDQDTLKNVFLEIESLEKTQIKTNGMVVYEDYHFTPLILGVVLFLISFSLRFFYRREFI